MVRGTTGRTNGIAMPLKRLCLLRGPDRPNGGSAHARRSPQGRGEIAKRLPSLANRFEPASVPLSQFGVEM
jgi:hypothetical protein